MMEIEKATASGGALDSGLESEKADTLCFTNDSQTNYITGEEFFQLQNKAMAELVKYRFSLAELDCINTHGFNDLQIYIAVLDLLVNNQASEENVHDVFREALPEIFVPRAER